MVSKDIKSLNVVAKASEAEFQNCSFNICNLEN